MDKNEIDFFKTQELQPFVWLYLGAWGRRTEKFYLET